MASPFDQIDSLERFMRKYHPNDIMMPVWGPGAPICTKTGKPYGEKQPMSSHANGGWSWGKLSAFRSQNPSHLHYSILMKTICVVDFDVRDIMAGWECRFPELQAAPMETSKKGGHFFFKRSALADTDGYYDGARQAPGGESVDFKSCCSTGTGGVIVVCPSGERQWVRAVWDYPMTEISDDLLKAIAVSRKKVDVIMPIKRASTRTGSGSGSGRSQFKCDPSQSISFAILQRIVSGLSDSRAVPRALWMHTVLAIHAVCAANGYLAEGKALAHSFSRRGRSVYDRQGVDTMYDSATEQGGGKCVGIGSLLAWLKVDEVQEFQAVQILLKASKDSGPTADSYAFVDEGQDVIGRSVTSDAWLIYGEALLKLDSKMFCGMSEVTFSITPEDRMMCTFADTSSNVVGTIAFPDCTVRVDGVVIGKLIPDFRLTGLKRCNLGIADQAEFLSERVMGDDIDKFNFVGVGLDAHIEVFDLSGKQSNPASVRQNGKEMVLTSKKSSMLLDAITQQGYRHIESSLGAARGSAASYFNITINNTINVNVVDPNALRTSDLKLMRALMIAKPEMISRLRFSPDAKSGCCNGIYYCDPHSNIWSQVHNLFVEDLLVESILQGTLSKADERYIETQRSAGELRKILVRKIMDVKFDELIDANLDIFPVLNGVFDVHDGVSRFRDRMPCDMVATTTGWRYDMGQGGSMRGEVEDFLAKVLPVVQERRVVLSYFAHLMSGRRRVKKFIALTDRRAGNNGKSAFAQLLTMFFGKLAKTSTKFVCKGSFDKDKDSHDGGVEPFKGKRLLLAEELKHVMTLDEAMLKSYTGGRVQVEGRKVGLGETFNFIWQAGFLIIFNEGDCPKFDAADQAFMERMIVVPMRSKFVAMVGDDDDPYTFQVIKDIDAKFPFWLSAFCDILMEHQDTDVFDDVPASMKEWRQDVMEKANPVSEWLLANVEVTGERSDMIVMGELKRAYVSSCVPPKFPNADFPRLSRAFLCAMRGVAYCENMTKEGRKLRGVMRGVRRKSLLVDDCVYVTEREQE